MTKPPPLRLDPAPPRGLLRFLWGAGGLWRDPALLMALGASLSRFALIFAVNETARRAGGGAGGGPVVLLVAAAMLFLWLSYLSQYRSHVVISRVQTLLRGRMSALLLRADIDFLLSREHGQVYDAMTSDITDLSEAIVWLLRAAEAVIVVAIAIPYLFYISYAAGLATLAAIGVGAVGFVLLDPPARRHARVARDANGEFCGRVEDMLHGWQELRLNAPRAQALEGEAQSVIDRVRVARLRSERLFSGATTVSQSAMVLLLCFVVVLVPLMQGAGADMMFQVLTVVLLTYGPIEALFNALPRISVGRTAYDRICRVEAALRAAQSDADAPDTAPDEFDSIALHGVTADLGQGGEGFRLGPVDLQFHPGETVFITGGNGSGKTTLMALLTGLRRPDTGAVIWDGAPVDDARAPAYRALFSGVFSDFHLFDRAYGMTGAECAALEARIASLGLAQKVDLIAGRFSTLGLSAGQKRRLALAVALAEARPILVLDEYAADQDPASRAFFYDVLLPEMAASGKLVIAITHDDHQFGKCDRLVRMDAGQVTSVIAQPREKGQTHD